MVWATVSSWSCFCWLYRASPSLTAKNIINLISVLTIWWCPCIESSLVLLEEGVCYDQCISWQNSISLCPASFHIPRPNLPVTPGVSWFSTIGAFQSPIVKRTSFLGVSSKRSCRSHRTIQLLLLQHYWLGHRLGLLWYWMVYLGNEQRSFCRFWDCIQVLHFRLFCWPGWLLHFFWVIPARSSRCMNKASGGDEIPVELFQILKYDAVKVLHSICQKIWIFTLTLSYLTTFNLPWFFQWSCMDVRIG